MISFRRLKFYSENMRIKILIVYARDMNLSLEYYFYTTCVFIWNIYVLKNFYLTCSLSLLFIQLLPENKRIANRFSGGLRSKIIRVSTHRNTVVSAWPIRNLGSFRSDWTIGLLVYSTSRSEWIYGRDRNVRESPFERSTNVVLLQYLTRKFLIDSEKYDQKRDEEDDGKQRLSRGSWTGL